MLLSNQPNDGESLGQMKVFSTVVFFACVSFCWNFAGHVFGQEGMRPNVVIILTDDHGYGDVSAYHDSDVRTPAIDSIARDGLLFTRMRANCTVCSPTRAALLTGLYADRVGVPGVIRTHREDSWGYFKPGVSTLGDELKKVGYHTAAIGKWHLGLQSPNTPNERGFDHFHGFLGDMMDSYISHLRHGQNYMRLDQQVIEPKGHATELFTDWAIEYLQHRSEDSSQPFFLYLAYNAPHFPIEPPEEYLQRVKARAPELTEARAANVAFVEHLDANISRLLNAMKDLNLAENTLVVFTADNGGSLPHGQNNDPWRDGKQSHYDGGLRVPFMIRWPAVVAGGRTSNYAGLVFDVFPTVLELADSSRRGLDAVSLVPILKGGEIQGERDLYFTRREGGVKYGGRSYEALIKGKWKLMQNDPYSPLELYDLENDPSEKNDLAQKEKKVVAELSAILRRHIQRGGEVPWQDISPQGSE